MVWSVGSFPATTYPTDADVQALVQSLGVTLPSGIIFDGSGAAAAQEWERLTGRIPFLNPSTVTTRTFEVPGAKSTHNSVLPIKGGGRRLPLQGGVISISSVTVEGQNKVVGSDVYPGPVNNPAIGKPYDYLEFAVPQYGQIRSVQVTGKFGFSSTLNELQFLSIVRLGAARIMDDVRVMFAANPELIRTTDKEIRFPQLEKAINLWRQEAEREAKRYVALTQYYG